MNHSTRRFLHACTGPILGFLMFIGSHLPTVASERLIESPSIRQTVLILSSVPLDITGFKESICSALQEGAKAPIDIFDEYTGLDRFSGTEYEGLLLRLYNEKYSRRKVDLLIVIGPTALDFILAKHFLPDVPVVTCFIPRRTVEAARTLRPEMTGALHPQNGPLTVDLMLSLYPRTRRIQVVIGANQYERHQTELARVMFHPYAGRVEFEYLNDLSLEQMEARLRNLPDDELVLFAQLHTDASGRDLTATDTITRLCKASRRPVFCLNTVDLGRGTLGGVLLSMDLAAKASAQVGLRVLEGQAASAMPLVPDKGAVPMFDWRQVKRWGVRERALPPGCILQFRERGLWDAYWKELSAGLILIVLESLLVAALLIQLRRRRRTEHELAKAKVRYRTVADFTHDWEFWQRPDEGFDYMSPACEQVSGYTPDAFTESPGLLAQIVLEVDRPAWEAYQREALKGRTPSSIEFRILTKADEVRWVEQDNNPVRIGGIFEGTRGSIRDITRRKQGELDLKQAYAEIRGLKESLEAENTYYRDKIQAEEGSNELLGSSDPMKYLLFRIRQVAPSETTVLIQGETGTGKELVAEAIHKLGPRKDRPLIKINCAALPQALAESELFGHEKGAFTGAQAQRKGRFELAHGATLFLDEIGELSPEVQAKLLRVLQDGEFQRVGGDRTIKVDVRVIAATNRDLAKEVSASRFREDLWYRLNVFPITVPTLRQRVEDIAILTQAFVTRFCQKLGRPILDIPRSVLQALQSYAWPGNVRELQNVIERAVLVSDGTSLRLADPLNQDQTAPSLSGPVKGLITVERDYILQILDSTKWKVEGPKGAAQLLQMKPSTLRNRMVKLGIERHPE